MRNSNDSIARRSLHNLLFVLSIACILVISLLPRDIDSSVSDRSSTRSTTWVPAEGWSEDKRLTYTVNARKVYNISSLPDIASEGSNVHIVFMYYEMDPDYKPLNHDLNIYYTRSVDGGRHWLATNDSKYIQLNSPIKNRSRFGAMNPTIAVSNSIVHVAWDHRDAGEGCKIRYRRSPDSGLSWDDEVILETKNEARLPQILANGTSVHLFWEETNTSSDPLIRGRIYYSRSTDGGVTWETRRELGRKVIEGPGCHVPVAAGDGRRVFLVYHCGDPPVTFFHRSLDYGQTWEDGEGNEGKRTLIHESTWHDDWIPITMSVWNERVVVVFTRMILEKGMESKQLVSMISDDEGKTWTGPYVLVDHTDVPFYRPDTFPPPNREDWGNEAYEARLASEGPLMYLVWTDFRMKRIQADDDDIWRNTEIFFMKSEDAGFTWGPQIRLTEARDSSFDPAIVASDGMIHVTWEDSRHDWSDTFYKRFPHFEAIPPEVETLEAYGITDSEAILKGRLKSLGNYTLANVYFQLRAQGEVDWTSFLVGKRHQTGEFEFGLSGLEPNETYEFRAVARTEVESFGEILNFTTGILCPPRALKASLHGDQWKDVMISWDASLDDPQRVSSYDIYFSSDYDQNGKNYTLLASVPSNGSSNYSYVHEDAGHRNANNYFYYIQANSTTYAPSKSEEQVAKISFPLSVGPQLLSIPLIPSEKRIDRAFQTLSFDTIWFYGAKSGWRTYGKFKPYGMELAEINRTVGVWVNVTHEGFLTITGIVPSETRIQLRKGWNLVGFPSLNDSYTVSDLMARTKAHRVEGFDFSAYPNHLRPMMDSDVLQWGCGYWVKVKEKTTWVVHF